MFMRYQLTYDLMESMRVTNQWMGSPARAMCSYPQLGLIANPAFQMTAAWGEVMERSFGRMAVKPDWNIPSIPGTDGRDHTVSIEKVVGKPFGDLK
jgi:poly(3-hydroxybutyrate) depolymerase